MSNNYRMSSEYNCAYHDLMLYLDNSLLNPIESKAIKEEVYQMMLENDMRHIPLSSLFPQGLDAFGEALVKSVKRQTWWQICLRIVNFIIFAILLMFCKELLMHMIQTGKILLPSTVSFQLQSFLWSLCYVSLLYSAAFIRKHYTLKKGVEKTKKTMLLLFLVVLFIFANRFFYLTAEVTATIPFVVPFLMVILLKVGIYYVLQMSYRIHFKKCTNS